MSVRARLRIVVMAVGSLIALYLTLLHYTTVVQLYCPGSGSGLINCGNVLTSPESVWLGIPVPLIGFVWFIAGIVLTVGQVRQRLWSPDWLYWVWSLAGVGAVLWLVYAELALIFNICLWCSVLHVMILGLFVDWVWSGSLTPDEPDDAP